jgi:hypothetical protein
LLGLASGCDRVLGSPDLGDPGKVSSMKTRFKATVQTEAGSPVPLDWGVADDRIWRHHMGPRSVAFCEHPADAPPMQRPCQISLFRDTFGSIQQIEVECPAHPPENRSAAPCSREAFRSLVDRRGLANPVGTAKRHANAETAPTG